jgi:hypothetical protein
MKSLVLASSLLVLDREERRGAASGSVGEGSDGRRERGFLVSKLGNWN